jgi:hypothetical protein
LIWIGNASECGDLNEVRTIGTSRQTQLTDIMTPKIRAQIRMWLLIGCIPAVAVAVAARQVYLSKFHGLSTWKGGGMGMFADADNAITRFAKIYIELPDGQRQPLTSLTPAQQLLLSEALWYPTRANLRRLAASIRRTNWAATDQLTPIPLVNVEGERMGPSGESYYSLHPIGERSGEEPDWTLAIEYWRATFDPIKRTARATLVKTLRYAKGEA